MIKEIKRLGGLPDYVKMPSATVTLADMAEKTITADVRVDPDVAPIKVESEWALEFDGAKYVMALREPQASKENTLINPTLNLTFHHWAENELKRYYFFTVQPTDSGTAVADKYIAPVSLNLGDFCELFSDVLRHYFLNKITLDLNPDYVYDTEPTTVEISYSYLWNVLIKFYELWGVRWTIEPAPGCNNAVKGGECYVIKVGYGAEEISHILEYGFEGGLLKVERQVQSDEMRNMALGRGGSRNLPYRYFKDVDPQNPSFPADPDWVPELRNIYFSELRGKAFRDYIRGWKTNAGRQLTETDGTPIKSYGSETPIAVEPTDTALMNENVAYRMGHTDDKFNPIEWVSDKYIVSGFDIEPEEGSSIDLYGELMTGFENNEDIYPTIQGVYAADHPDYFPTDIGRIDEAVAVEEIKSDDVTATTEREAVLVDIAPMRRKVAIDAGTTVSVTFDSKVFEIEEGKTGTFEPGAVTLKNDSLVLSGTTSVVIYNADEPSVSHSASGIPAGRWYARVTASVQNNSEAKIESEIALEHAKLTKGTPANQWANTWCIWIKDIWQVARKPTETARQYAERVWAPILGGREGEEAKVVFSDGWLSTSQDYEFTIVKTPELDTTKSRGGVQSKWKLTLAKSDADLESTGLYLPSTKHQAQAGDHFFFIGIELPAAYVRWAEASLDNYKSDELAKLSKSKPMWVVTLDKVRADEQGAADSLRRQIKPGASVRIADKWFTESAAVRLYVQTLTLTYKDPTNDDAALIPDIEVTLGDDYTSIANPVATMKGDIEALSRQIGSLSSIEKIVRQVGDRLYLRKDGLPDRSVSPTQFGSLVTSVGFRQGMVGGAGWGIFRDEQGRTYIETDCLRVRQEMAVNSLVINQVQARGGMIVESAAAMSVSNVVQTPGTKTGSSYTCYFDTKEGTVPNLFTVGDIALCMRFDPEAMSSSPSEALKFYKRPVTAVGDDYIILGTGVGEGVPEIGDVIVQWGNTTNEARQSVIVRDVIGGGYERFIDGLDSLSAEGTEYYFVGRQTGMYNGRPRFFIGDTDSYLEYIDGVLRFKGVISTEATMGDTTVDQYISNTVLQEVAKVTGGRVNLLRNTDFRGEMSEWWTVETYQSSTWTLQNPLASNIDAANRQFAVSLPKSGGRIDLSQQLPVDSVKSAGMLTMSFDCFATIGASVKVTPVLSVKSGTAAAQRYAFPTVTLGVARSQVSLDISEVTWGSLPSATLILELTGYGSGRISSLMLEQGSTNQGWTASPLDNLYLRSALKEATKIAGGLILASLIKVGFTQNDGTYKVMSGINGVVDPEAAGNGIALWSGGEQKDRDNSADEDAATWLVRHDGTGYAAKNTIKFKENMVTVGANDEMRMLKEGVYLYEGNHVRLQITNTAIPTNLDKKTTPTTVTLNQTWSCTYSVDGGSAVTVPSWATQTSGWQTIGTFAINNGSRIEGGSVITCNLQAILHGGLNRDNPTLPGGISAPMFPEVRIQLVRVSTGVAVWEAKSRMEVYNSITTTGMHTYITTVPSGGGIFQLVLSFKSYGVTTTGTPESGQITVQMDATCSPYNDSKTILGKDGFYSAWGDTILLASAQQILMRHGRFGLRISDAGIEKWSAIDSEWVTVLQ